MRYTIKKHFQLILILAIILIACEDNDIKTPVDEKKYKFIDLKYNFSDKEEVVFEQLFRKIEYYNSTSEEQVLPIGGLSSVNNYMFFESNNEITNYFFRDSILVNIPKFIDDERIYLTDEKYLFSPNNVRLPIYNLPNDTLKIEPNSTIRININLVLKEYTIDFDLSYWDNILNKQQVLRGKWKMVQFVKLRNEYI